MAPSASATRTLAVAAATFAVAGLLSGCVSTQTKAARLRVNADRIRASQSTTRVTTANAEVTVDSVAMVTARRRTVFVVTVNNRSDRASSDLPILVGYRERRGRTVYRNAAAGLDYFAAHLPVIAAHGSLTWVSEPTRPLPRGARPFAMVGPIPSVQGTATGRTPSIRVGAGTATADRITVRVRNLSGVPQYQLPVYAVVERDGRTTAAGTATVTKLDGGATETLGLPLLGHVGNGPVQLEAAPTIVH